MADDLSRLSRVHNRIVRSDRLANDSNNQDVSECLTSMMQSQVRGHEALAEAMKDSAQSTNHLIQMLARHGGTYQDAALRSPRELDAFSQEANISYKVSRRCLEDTNYRANRCDRRSRTPIRRTNSNQSRHYGAAYSAPGKATIFETEHSRSPIRRANHIHNCRAGVSSPIPDEPKSHEQIQSRSPIRRKHRSNLREGPCLSQSISPKRENGKARRRREKRQRDRVHKAARPKLAPASSTRSTRSNTLCPASVDVGPKADTADDSSSPSPTDWPAYSDNENDKKR